MCNTLLVINNTSKIFIDEPPIGKLRMKDKEFLMADATEKREDVRSDSPE
jgi:hypothetical protein